MTPSIDDRLGSVIRALSDVILPHLPPSASLAQEQAQLAIGHLQILRAQIDQAPLFEREELNDALALAQSLRKSMSGGPRTQAALSVLEQVIANDKGLPGRTHCKAVNTAIEGVVQAASADGTADVQRELRRLVLLHEAERVVKDRAWFAPFGFDTAPGEDS